MKINSLILLLFTAIAMRCSSGGSFGDFAGGGVIGNPTQATFVYSDTVHCTVATVVSVQPGPGGDVSPPITLYGFDTATTNQLQRYACAGVQGNKRFLFSSAVGEQISFWSADSEIIWTWTTAGICSVQVQIAKEADTSKWSVPLIVHILK
jgi:hypothetical protein